MIFCENIHFYFKKLTLYCGNIEELTSIFIGFTIIMHNNTETVFLKIEALFKNES